MCVCVLACRRRVKSANYWSPRSRLSCAKAILLLQIFWRFEDVCEMRTHCRDGFDDDPPPCKWSYGRVRVDGRILCKVTWELFEMWAKNGESPFKWRRFVFKSTLLNISEGAILDWIMFYFVSFYLTRQDTYTIFCIPTLCETFILPK